MNDRQNESEKVQDGGYSPLMQRLVMVDDKRIPLEGFVKLVHELHPHRWEVEILPAAPDLLNLLMHAFPHLPDLVSIDLGLPPDERSPRYGLELLEQVHQGYPGLKIVVHSVIEPIPEWASQYILSVAASYISTAHDKDLLAYAQMLPLIAQGFRIYSPAVSETLSHVVVRHPDPLDDNEWQIVELIARGLSTLKIKEETHFSESTIADKISRMARRLNALGHITVNTEDRRPIPNRYRDALSRFYKENAVRYGRHRRP